MMKNGCSPLRAAAISVMTVSGSLTGIRDLLTAAVDPILKFSHGHSLYLFRGNIRISFLKLKEGPVFAVG